MADAANTADDPELQDVPAEEVDEPAADDAPAGEAAAEGEGSTTDEAPADEPEGLIVTIGDETPPEEAEENAAPTWVKDLRRQNREMARALRQRDEELTRLKGSGQAAAVVVGEKPTLAGCEFDEAKFEAELSAWHDRKRQADDAQRERQQAEQKAQQAWQATLSGYKAAAAQLKVANFEEAEQTVQDSFSVVQQGIMLKALKQPALVVYALGMNPKKAKELAAITDPVEFAGEVARLETQIKAQPRKSPPPPTRNIGGGTGGSGVGGDLELARLEKEAQRTGDRSKVVAYKRKQQQAA